MDSRHGSVLVLGVAVLVGQPAAVEELFQPGAREWRLLHVFLHELPPRLLDATSLVGDPSPSPSCIGCGPRDPLDSRLAAALSRSSFAVNRRHVFTDEDRRKATAFCGRTALKPSEERQDTGEPGLGACSSWSRLVVFSDFDKYFSYVIGHEGRTQLAAVNWIADYIAPANFLFEFACPRLLGGPNLSEFCSPRIDALMRRAAKAQTANPALALALWAKVDRTVADEAPAIFLANPRGITLVSKRVGNFQTHPQYGPLLDQLWVQ